MAVASLFEDLLDQYKIEQSVAEKRYTDLYQAYDVDDDLRVRLDILRDVYANDGAFAGRFVDRARALAQVRHPNIAQVLHIGKDTGGAPYVAQSAIDGYSLSYRLEQLAQRNIPANPIYTLKLVRQLADALLLAERLEIFHHDLQPDNILLKNVTLPNDETVVLIDLFIPIERNRHAPGRMDQSSQLGYLSPEQRNGKEITAASHVYSLGVILFQLLAGSMPKRPVSMRDTVFSHLFGRATALERERPGLAQATYQLVDRSLRKDSRRRYASIESFIPALESALVAEELRLGMETTPATTAGKPQAWLVPLLILALLLAVGAVAGRGLIDPDNRLNRTATSPTTLAAGISIVEAMTPTLAPTLESIDPTMAASRGMAAIVDDTATPANEVIVPTQANTTPTPEPTPTATPLLEPTITQQATPVPPRVRVMHNMVNLRRGPGVDYALMGNVTGGDLLEVLAWNNDGQNPWYLVITEDQRIGWIAATVVQPENPDAMGAVPEAATLPPTAVPSATPTATLMVGLATIMPPTTDPGDLGGGGGDETPPPQEPTDSPPTQPPIEPTATLPPFPTDSP